MKPKLSLLVLYEQLKTTQAEINALVRQENEIRARIAKLEAIQ